MSKMPSTKELAYFHVRGFSWEELSQKYSVPLKDLLNVEDDPQWPTMSRDARRGLRRFLRDEMVFLLRESAHDENPRIALDARKTLLRYLTPNPRTQTRKASPKPEIPATPKPVPVAAPVTIPAVEKTAPPAGKLGMLGGISTLFLLAFSMVLFLATVAGGALRNAKSAAAGDTEGSRFVTQRENIWSPECLDLALRHHEEKQLNRRDAETQRRTFLEDKNEPRKTRTTRTKVLASNQTVS